MFLTTAILTLIECVLSNTNAAFINNHLLLHHLLELSVTECLDPESVAFSIYGPFGPYYHLNVVMYTCDYGYEITAGNDQRTCDDGTWNGTSPTCSRKGVLDELYISET